MNFDKIKDNATVEKTVKALNDNGFDAYYFESEEDLKKKVFELIPEGAEVMTMTSRTLDILGLADELNSEKYDSVRNKLNQLNRQTDSAKMQKLGSAPEYTIGSVHAVTEDGKIVIASNTGSQLSAEVYGSQHVVFVVGTQKITKDLDEATKRIYEYTLPLESERANKAYGVPGSFVSKLLILNREIMPHRVSVLFINEAIGF